MSKSMIVAVIALFFSLTGWGVAAKVALAPANSVGTQQIVNGSIRLADLHPSAIKLLRGQQGQQGVEGTVGPMGPAGPTGGFNLGKLSSAFSSASSVAPGSLGEATAQCPAGSVPIGGGFSSALGSTLFSAAVSGGWRILVGNNSSSTIPIYAFVVCAAP